MKDFPQDPSEAFERLKLFLKLTADEKAVRVAATADWVGLIEQAMACNPAPLRELLRQIGTSRTSFYPQAMLDFLSLMEKYKPKSGRPCKDGNEAIRAAAKAWETSYLKDALNTSSNAFSAAKKLDKRRDRHIRIDALPYKISIKVDEGAGKKVARLPGLYKATDLALKTMADSLFGTGDEALRNKIYPRKKGTTKKPK